MMSTELIQQMSDEAAERAAAEGLTPYVPWDTFEVDDYGLTRPIPFPNIGSLRPEGWELAEHRMADKTGMGADDEPALTIDQLKRWVVDHPGDGWAIIEEGQFQVVIGRFTRER